MHSTNKNFFKIHINKYILSLQFIALFKNNCKYFLCDPNYTPDKKCFKLDKALCLKNQKDITQISHYNNIIIFSAIRINFC